ncbi:MAG: glycosyltransferase family 61 protein [Verrucomicrobia bacterium]|nr:glycosyltransferase family 61 protein [Verrucomicrobiota bacterium]
MGSKSFAVTGIPQPPVDMQEKIKWVVAKQKCNWQLPQSIQDYQHPLFQLPSDYKDHTYPEEGVLELPGGTATSTGANLNSSGALVTTFLTPADGKAPQYHPAYYFSLRRFFPRILTLKEPVISLTDIWQGAFFHWMYQVLPRLGLLTAPYAKIFVEQKHDFQRQSIELLGCQDCVISTAEYDAVQASQVIIPSSFLCPTHRSCQFLRDSFLPKVPILPKRKIYLSRTDARTRRLANEVEVIDILDQYGFERVELTPLSFREQIAVLKSADMVVATHGAGLSHLVFCDPGTAVLELFHANYVNNCYWQLSTIRDLIYYMLFDTRPSAEIDPDIYIEPVLLRRTLEAMERDRSCR